MGLEKTFIWEKPKHKYARVCTAALEDYSAHKMEESKKAIAYKKGGWGRVTNTNRKPSPPVQSFNLIFYKQSSHT